MKVEKALAVAFLTIGANFPKIQDGEAYHTLPPQEPPPIIRAFSIKRFALFR
jgi:hypothetical protein